MESELASRRSFEAFLDETEAGLRHALVALYGVDDGRDAAAQALLYGWEHWDRVKGMSNPAGYLFRAGQTWARRNRKGPTLLPSPPDHREPWVEPSLAGALRGLPDKQRVAVMLRHGSDWTYEGIAQFTNSTPAAVRKNVQRGLASLRTALEVQVES